jgi:predicted nucleic acid-binding protein
MGLERQKVAARSAESKTPGQYSDLRSVAGRPGLILYLDSSAIVKQYIVELGSEEVHHAVAQSEINGTSVISCAEVTAAFRKGIRAGALLEKDAIKIRKDFDREWPNLLRTRITEKLSRYAATLAWLHGLRGYDSIHLASAAAWQQALRRQVTLATFDKSLWIAAPQAGLGRFPEDLPTLLREWRPR